MVKWSGQFPLCYAAMAYCPNCNAEVPANANMCVACSARFEGDGWKPTAVPGQLPPADSGTHWLRVILKAIAALACLTFLGWGALWASQGKSGGWGVATLAMALAVVLVAVRARARWMLLMLPLTFAFGFASCSANFRWGGG